MSRALPPFLKKHFLDQTLRSLPLHDAVTSDGEKSIGEALHVFVEHRIGSLLVLEDGRLSGIVTERDLVMKLDPYAAGRQTLRSLMTPNPQTLPPQASIARVLYTFFSGGFRHIPVHAPDSERLQICSVRDVVDFIYRRIANRVLNETDNGDEIADSKAVQMFFESPVSVLRPAVPQWVRQECTAEEGLRVLRKYRIGSVVVGGSDGRMLGIVTERDFLTKLLAQHLDPAVVTVRELMTRDPSTVLISSSVSRALDFLVEGRFRHLPVVDHDELLVGVLSVKSILAFLAERILEDLG